jgi:glycerol-3-phosphate acyltransferase PlsY
MALEATFLVFTAYIVGSIPTGLILAKSLGHVDIRSIGSRNIGATNVYRNLGRSLGALTLAGDALKGFLPVFLARVILQEEAWIVPVGVAAFLGHVYPLFLKFKGGKGVATGLGVFLCMAPLSIIPLLIIFALVVYCFRTVSLASLLSAASLPLTLYLLDYPTVYFQFSFFFVAMIFLSHRGNIRRLIAGTEPKVSTGS